MELVLSRELAERRIFPAIDIKKSGTRREDLLLDAKTMENIYKVRRGMRGDALEYTESFLKQMNTTENNEALLTRIALMK